MSAPAQSLDLGPIDSEILVFGGPYSNLEATEAVLAAAAGHGIPAGRVICTGDVVAYCADAELTAQRIREAGIHVVMGNCEESFGSAAGDCGCGFEEDSACDVLSRQWYAYADATLSAVSRQWMAATPREIRFRLQGRSFTAIHGGAREISRFIFASTPEAVLREEMASLNTDAVIGGHCGLPFTRAIGAGLWHNAGVVGMPANDGTPRAWYALLTPGADGIRVSHHALAYDHGAAAAKMRARGLPEGYAQALLTGLWPNTDILPEAETAASGAALAPSAHLWRHTESLAAAT